MRFVPIKSPEQQSVLMLHRSRDLLMRQRTMLLNAIRAHLTEFGIITAQGPAKVLELVAQLRTGEALGLPDIVRSALLSLTAQLDSLALGIRSLERQLMAWHRSNTASQRLEAIPRVGLLTATALAASVPDPTVFHSGRQFAAYLGLVPRQNSSGGKERLGRISKMGNGALRRLLVVGTTSVIRKAGSNATRTGAWVRSLLERKPARLTTVAVANSERGGATGSSVPRTARIAWALRARGDGYRSGAPA
jgi:transposase